MSKLSVMSMAARLRGAGWVKRSGYVPVNPSQNHTIFHVRNPYRPACVWFSPKNPKVPFLTIEDAWGYALAVKDVSEAL